MDIYTSGYIQTGAIHHLYYQAYGNSDGIPVLFLHGGPGSGYKSSYTQFFEGHNVNLVAFDQRGAGQSLPKGSLEDNRTPDLIADIEILRNHFNINQLNILGYSWGAALALTYAIEHPQHVQSLILASTFLARKKDSDWSFDGARQFLPEIFDRIEHNIDCPNGSIREGLTRLIFSDKQDENKKGLFYLSLLGENLDSMQPQELKEDDISLDGLSRARIVLNYAENNFFLPDNHIINNIHVIDDIPIYALHGQFDLNCPPVEAYELKSLHNNTHLQIVSGGHNILQEPMKSAFRSLLSLALSK